ncbi:MAG: FKBP-type peptidyl-prolyl cis-trans isomerase [Aeriscardovia sp.]|nr:FKBP-type peptidyl-prolyl cis-trans isomerase [Aeriscardovia sp.]
MFNVHFHRSKAAKLILAALAAAGMLAALAACGNSSSSSSSASSQASSSLAKLEGVSATGESGQEPQVHFKTPMTISQKSYAVLIDGTGAKIKEGDTVCYQYMVYNARTGSQIDSTWKDAPSCTLTLNSSMDSDFDQVLSSQKVGASVAFGTPGSQESSSASGAANSGDAYISVMTLISVVKTLSKAEGTQVENIPSDLPKVTSNSSTGEPSVDFNNYKSDGQFVAQTIIKGSGPSVSSSGSVVVKYSGWVLGTKKLFQSTWNEGNTTASFSLANTIEGFQKGLSGQTVGSQVLLIIPPSMGYGSNAQSGIPANSTLVFVVDILGTGN